MIQLEKETGILKINGESISKINSSKTNGHWIKKDFYNSTSIAKINIDGLICDVNSFYKNDRLTSINISLTPDYLKSKYNPTKDIDFRDYLSPYIEFCETETEELLIKILGTTKRNYEWGKVGIKTDPRDYFIFIEIRYKTTD